MSLSGQHDPFSIVDSEQNPFSGAQDYDVVHHQLYQGLLEKPLSNQKEFHDWQTRPHSPQECMHICEYAFFSETFIEPPLPQQPQGLSIQLASAVAEIDAASTPEQYRMELKMGRVGILEDSVENDSRKENKVRKCTSRSLASCIKRLIDSDSLQSSPSVTFEELERGMLQKYKAAYVKELGLPKMTAAQLSNNFNKKKCNQTRSIKTLLAGIVEAYGTYPPFKDISKEVANFRKSKKIEDIQNALNQLGLDFCRHLLKNLLFPGHQILILVDRLVQLSALSKYLIIEGVRVLQRMMEERNVKCNSWIPQKLDVRGQYSSIIARLNEQTITIQEVREFVMKEHLKCSSSSKHSKKCSPKNNVNHFIRNLLRELLQELLKDLTKKLLEATNQADAELKQLVEVALQRTYELPNLKNNIHTMAEPAVRRAFHNKFSSNQLLLVKILSLDRTNALNIKNLVDHYDEIKGLVTRIEE